mmetsp:Transcript_4585/g.11799  ORF Transcript_4585/g.11799 Transcript_4585/m.11799 type:complete len:489 (+) Transcript_4585:130-1596(+)
MVQGMAFLSKKGFNPQNNTNRKQVWEAQQRSIREKERLRKRQAQLKREQEDEELELASKGVMGASQAQLRFMYDAPPGMEKRNENAHLDENGNGKNANDVNNAKFDSENDLNNIALVKPGDDAAAVAFRQMFAAAASNTGQTTKNGGGETSAEDQATSKTFKFTPSLQGSTVEADMRYNNNSNNSGDIQSDGAKKASKIMKDSRSALEKEVGRKNRSSQNNLSYEQQIERFPQLKNAPMAIKRRTTTDAENEDAADSAPMMVHFKPLGSQILHVRCLACGIWGHARGDRECKKSGWNPFALPSSTNSRQKSDTATGIVSSSILPSKRGDPVNKNEFGESERTQRKNRHSRHYDSDSDDSDRRRRRRERKRRRRYRNESSKNDRYDDSDGSSQISDRYFSKHRGRRYEEKAQNHNHTSYSSTSSDDDGRLKRRKEDRYDSSSEDDDERHRRDDRRQSKKRHRDRKHSKRNSSKRYESSSSHKKKKKKRY